MKRLFIVMAIAGLIGCGSSVNSHVDGYYSESEVARLAKFTSDGVSWYYKGCTVYVIMTTRDMISMYTSAGDAVVVNPAGNVGVKISSHDPSCRSKLHAALEGI